jgi:hypothetical protein
LIDEDGAWSLLSIVVGLAKMKAICIAILARTEEKFSPGLIDT